VLIQVNKLDKNDSNLFAIKLIQDTAKEALGG
jgi:hypothetical protein